MSPNSYTDNPKTAQYTHGTQQEMRLKKSIFILKKNLDKNMLSF